MFFLSSTSPSVSQVKPGSESSKEPVFEWFTDSPFDPVNKCRRFGFVAVKVD